MLNHLGLLVHIARARLYTCSFVCPRTCWRVMAEWRLCTKGKFRLEAFSSLVFRPLHRSITPSLHYPVTPLPHLLCACRIYSPSTHACMLSSIQHGHSSTCGDGKSCWQAGDDQQHGCSTRRRAEGSGKIPRTVREHGQEHEQLVIAVPFVVSFLAHEPQRVTTFLYLIVLSHCYAVRVSRLACRTEI